MPKAILEFDRETEESEFRDAVNGSRWKFAMQELEQELKHYEGTSTEIRSLLNEIVSDRGLVLFD